MYDLTHSRIRQVLQGPHVTFEYVRGALNRSIWVQPLDGGRVGMGVANLFDRLSDPVRHKKVIIVKEEDQVARGMCEARIPGGAWPHVARVPNELGVDADRQSHRGIGGVVHNNQLNVAVRLRHYRGKGLR